MQQLTWVALEAPETALKSLWCDVQICLYNFFYLIVNFRNHSFTIFSKVGVSFLLQTKNDMGKERKYEKSKMALKRQKNALKQYKFMLNDV